MTLNDLTAAQPKHELWDQPACVVVIKNAVQAVQHLCAATVQELYGLYNYGYPPRGPRRDLVFCPIPPKLQKTLYQNILPYKCPNKNCSTFQHRFSKVIYKVGLDNPYD
eukprot:4169413-Karenia_brevis.AAC.1